MQFTIRAKWAAALILGLCWTAAASAYTAKPKFGPDAIPIEQATDYLRNHPAPDYWAISPFYIPQQTDSDCSAASVAILLNALKGVPARADQDLITIPALLKAPDNARWAKESARNGTGVTFEELDQAVVRSLKRYNLTDDHVETFKPTDSSAASLAAVQRLLAANEQSSRDIALVYFDQGILTGDWDGPHISPIGAYDAESGRVLIMDVDRRYYVPYWSPVTKLLDSMLRPAPARFGPLGGQTGGIVWVRPADAAGAPAETLPAAVSASPTDAARQ